MIRRTLLLHPTWPVAVGIRIWPDEGRGYVVVGRPERRSDDADIYSPHYHRDLLPDRYCIYFWLSPGRWFCRRSLYEAVSTALDKFDELVSRQEDAHRAAREAEQRVTEVQEHVARVQQALEELPA